MAQITLAGLESLAARLLNIKEELEYHEGEVATRVARIQMIEQNLLPNCMREILINEFKLADGRHIVLDQKISCGVTDAKMPVAEAWLAEHGLDGIIKHQVIAEFGKGENDNAKLAMEALEELRSDGIIGEGSLVDKKAIHYQTLAATIREQMRKGVDFPEEPFNLFITDTVKIK